MAEAVIMPRQGQSVESCIFSEWFKKKGDVVKKGDLLFAYETDKAAFEQEATADGILLETFVKEGDEVPVLQSIGVIGQEGESIDTLNPGNVDAATEEPSKEETTVAEESNITEAQVKTYEPAGETKTSPRARILAKKHSLDLEGISGSGPYGRVIERDVQRKLSEKPRATPLAKAIASQENKELPKQGSGFGGKILAADVKQMPSITLANDYEDKKISNIRKIIAQNMYESLANTAQLTLHVSADARKILEFRQTVKAKQKDGYSYNITINDLVAFAIVKALLKHPALNAHFLGDSMRTFGNVHLGFAVDTPRGLMVPTVQNANRLTIEGLSATMKELAASCQQGNVSPEVLQGATFTITNLGAFGVEMFTPVLNPPQTGILGINNIKPEPADLGGGVFGFVPKIGLSLTFDHRAVDGAPAAAFLQEVCKQLESLEINF